MRSWSMLQSGGLFRLLVCDEGFSLTPDGKACIGNLPTVQQLLIFCEYFVCLYLV